MKRVALLVGVEKYRDPGITPLAYAGADVLALGDRLSHVCGFDQVEVLAQAEGYDRPDSHNALRRFDELCAELDEDDLFLFYFSGHGVEWKPKTAPENEKSRMYLLTEDTFKTRPYQNSLSRELLSDALGNLAARRRILLFDACRNNPEQGKGDADNRMAEAVARDVAALAREVSVSRATTALYSACGQGKRSYEYCWRVGNREEGHGVFTHFLLEGLDGAAWRHEELEFRNLVDHTSRNVREWTSRMPAFREPQEPWYEEFGAGERIVLAQREKRKSDSSAVKNSEVATAESAGIITDISTQPPIQPRIALLSDACSITDPKQGIRVDPAFLNWPAGTLMVWVDVTEGHLAAPSNRYIFSHTSNWRDDSGHPNSFSLCAHGQKNCWRLVVGKQPKAHLRLSLPFESNIFGWHLFVVRWDRDKKTLDFCIDSESRSIRTKLETPDIWPEAGLADFWLGAYPSKYPGSEVNTSIRNFHVYDCVLDGGYIGRAWNEERSRSSEASRTCDAVSLSVHSVETTTKHESISPEYVNVLESQSTETSEEGLQETLTFITECLDPKTHRRFQNDIGRSLQSVLREYEFQIRTEKKVNAIALAESVQVALGEVLRKHVTITPKSQFGCLMSGALQVIHEEIFRFNREEFKSSLDGRVIDDFDHFSIWLIRSIKQAALEHLLKAGLSSVDHLLKDKTSREALFSHFKMPAGFAWTDYAKRESTDASAIVEVICTLLAGTLCGASAARSRNHVQVAI